MQVLAAALGRVAARHEALRTSVQRVDGHNLVQTIAKPQPVAVDASHCGMSVNVDVYKVLDKALDAVG